MRNQNGFYQNYVEYIVHSKVERETELRGVSTSVVQTPIVITSVDSYHLHIVMPNNPSEYEMQVFLYHRLGS